MLGLAEEASPYRGTVVVELPVAIDRKPMYEVRFPSLSFELYSIAEAFK